MLCQKHKTNIEQNVFSLLLCCVAWHKFSSARSIQMPHETKSGRASPTTNNNVQKEREREQIRAKNWSFCITNGTSYITWHHDAHIHHTQGHIFKRRYIYIQGHSKNYVPFIIIIIIMITIIIIILPLIRVSSYIHRIQTWQRSYGCSKRRSIVVYGLCIRNFFISIMIIMILLEIIVVMYV